MQIRQFPDPSTFRRLARHHNVIPVCVELLADTLTPVSLLGHFHRCQSSPLFLLESVEGGERWGRYSFLGISSRCRIKVLPDVVSFADAAGIERIPHHGRPFALLKAYMARFKAADLPQLPRFWGGLVGYLAYEAVSFFEPVAGAPRGAGSLAQFVLPDALMIFDNVRHSLFCLALAYLDEKSPVDRVYALAEQRIASMLASLEHPPALPADNGSVPPPARAVVPPATSFMAAVRQIKERIRSGDVIQTVISQPFVYEPAPDAWSLYRAQRYINPSPYLFFLAFDDITLVGSSPETMVRLENGAATLRPIAGTRPRGRSAKQDRLLADEMLKDEKERAEHLMLVDLGRNDLGRVAETGSVQVTELMVVERYSHVMHLVSNITCDLAQDLGAWDLLQAAFPAGTLTGAPKIKAMEIIAALENMERGPYGGAVGYIGFDGNMDMAITIRTAVIENGRLTVRAGAGIVADSDPQKEYEESVNKAKSVERAMALLAEQPLPGLKSRSAAAATDDGRFSASGVAGRKQMQVNPEVPQ